MTATRDEEAMMEKDLYAILGVKSGDGPKVIKRAYHDMALIWHPDKRPDDPDAPAKFDAIQKAYNILHSDTLRPMYVAKHQAQQDRKRKQAAESDSMKAMRDTLERKEKEHMATYANKRSKTQEAVDRQKNLAVFASMVNSEAAAKAAAAGVATVSSSSSGNNDNETTVVVRWKEGKASVTMATVEQVLSKHGRVQATVLAKGKGKCKALVTFALPEGARSALLHNSEQCGYGFKVSRPSSDRKSSSSASFTSPPPDAAAASSSTPVLPDPLVSSSSLRASGSNDPMHSHEDYEDMIMRKMMEAAAQKKAAAGK